MDARGVEVSPSAMRRKPGRLFERLGRSLATRGAGADCETRRGRRGGGRRSPPHRPRPETPAAAAPTRCSRRRRRRADGVLDHRVERAPARLVDVVLVLADADRLGVDLHQLGQRILESAAIETAPRSETSRSGNSRPPARRPSTPRRPPRHHHLRQVQIRGFGQVGGEAVGFARGGAVADATSSTACARGEASERGDGGVPVVPRACG